MKLLWLQVFGIACMCFLIGIRFAELVRPQLTDGDRIHMLHERISVLEDRLASTRTTIGTDRIAWMTAISVIEPRVVFTADLPDGGVTFAPHLSIIPRQRIP